MYELEFYFILINILTFIVGWFLSKEFYKISNIQKEELNALIEEKKVYLKKLEKECSQKQVQLDKLIDESIVCKQKLLQQSNLLRQKNDELYKLEEKIKNIMTINKKDNKLFKSLSNLSENEELIKLRRIVIQKDRLIENMKKTLFEKSDNYIEISKDQFHQIELRLKEYKQKADQLEKENSKLKILIQPKKKENKILDRLNGSISNVKEFALLGIFKNNYKKITKA